jgi:hypothetical protein
MQELHVVEKCQNHKLKYLITFPTYQDLCSNFASYSLENTLSKVKNHNLTLAPENRHYDTNRKITGSRPDGVDFF